MAATRQHTPDRRVVLGVMCVGYFLVLLDVTIVGVALPYAREDLGAGVSGTQWVVDGYAVALAALLLPCGALGDVRGHRPVVLSGLTVFGLASLICGVAPGTQVLIAGRVAQGVGAALLLPGTLAVIARLYPEPRAQARAIGVWAAAGSAALPAGPLLGGMLVEVAGWRSVFLPNVPIVCVACIVVAGSVREHRPTGRRRIDGGGTLLAAAALVLLTLALTRLGHTGADPVTVALAAAAVCAGYLLVRVERSHPDPVLPLELFRDRAFTTTNLVAAAMNLGTLGLLFLLTFYLQTAQHRSAIAAGTAMLPLFVPLTVLAPFVGRFVGRFGPRVPMTSGLLLAAGGIALCGRLNADSGYSTVLPVMLGWGVGLALLTPAVVAAAVGSVGASRAGLASGVNNTCRQAGGAIGVAAYGSIAGTPTHPAAFVDGLHTAAWVTVALFAGAAVLTMLVRPVSR